MKQVGIFLIMLFLSFTAAFASNTNPIIVNGIVHDQNGKPMAAAIVEQYLTHNYVITDINGKFSLKLLPSPESTKIEIRFVEYQTVTIDARKLGNSALLITLESAEPRNDNQEPKRDRLNAFNFKLGYDYTGANFNGFSELHSTQIALLNSLNHAAVLSLSGYYNNYLLDLYIGIHPNLTRRTESYRGIAQAHHVGLKFGYAFPVFKNTLFVTPTIAINRFQYYQYVAPLDNNISLEDYLQQGYLDISFAQWTGIVGAEFNWKIAEIGKRKQQAIMANIGGGYHFKLNQYPHIYAKRTDVTSPHKIGLNGLYLEASLRYIFTYKTPKEIKRELDQRRLTPRER